MLSTPKTLTIGLVFANALEDNHLLAYRTCFLLEAPELILCPMACAASNFEAIGVWHEGQSSVEHRELHVAEQLEAFRASAVLLYC